MHRMRCKACRLADGRPCTGKLAMRPNPLPTSGCKHEERHFAVLCVGDDRLGPHQQRAKRLGRERLWSVHEFVDSRERLDAIVLAYVREVVHMQVRRVCRDTSRPMWPRQAPPPETRIIAVQLRAHSKACMCNRQRTDSAHGTDSIPSACVLCALATAPSPTAYSPLVPSATAPRPPQSNGSLLPGLCGTRCGAAEGGMSSMAGSSDPFRSYLQVYT